MIALSTTSRTIPAALAEAVDQLAWIDTVEFRADLLELAEWSRLGQLPGLLRAALGQGPQPASAVAPGLKTILTLRRRSDGGGFVGEERDRMALLSVAARAGFDYLDLESDLAGDVFNGVVDTARRSGTTVIRSLHDFDATPDSLARTLRDLAVDDRTVVKAAVTPRSTADLGRLIDVARGLGDTRRIVLGMGPYGFPTRVLPAHLGNELTFCSTAGASAAPGHVSAREMHDSYRVHEHSPSTPVFAVIGNPIAHSKSPDYHNARFKADGVPAVYVPFLVDDVDAFVRVAASLPVQGFSVTIPHKQAIMPAMRRVSPDVHGADACNTAVLTDDGWFGTNTDIAGFLAPLDEIWRADLVGVRALVIGAGGAARGVVYALASRGCAVHVWNRTPERAEALARDAASLAGPTGTVESIDTARAIAVHAATQIVVNTTSVGMHGDGDPAEWLRLTGHELVYDIVYTPPDTPLIRRATSAGCRVVTGDRMFAAQAAAQYALYRERAMRVVGA